MDSKFNVVLVADRLYELTIITNYGYIICK